MNQLDLIILVAYTIIVILVLQRAIHSVDNRMNILLNKDVLQQSLEERRLAGKLDIAFKPPSDGYPIESPPQELSLAITNSSERPIYVDWDRSSFTAFDWDKKASRYREGRARRIVRFSPYKGLESVTRQVLSPIPPNSTLKEDITAEDTLVRDGDGLKLDSSLFKIEKLDEGESLDFWLYLVVYLQETETEDDRTCVLPCKFTVLRRPWVDSLPF
ncbi:MAG: hypothetical protein ACFB5Z_07740 [Elainellaceae cyanobacterium]